MSKKEQKTAVIIKGNPKYLKYHKKESRKFYSDIAKFMRSKGYKVRYNAGKPYTTPPDADIWIGHSRGVGRLRFSPEHTKTIGFGVPRHHSDKFTIVNHPKDERTTEEFFKKRKTTRGFKPSVEHYIFTDAMKRELEKIASRDYIKSLKRDKGTDPLNIEIPHPTEAPQISHMGKHLSKQKDPALQERAGMLKHLLRKSRGGEKGVHWYAPNHADFKHLSTEAQRGAHFSPVHKYVLSNSGKNPLTFSHEVGHLADFIERLGYKPRRSFSFKNPVIAKGNQRIERKFGKQIEAIRATQTKRKPDEDMLTHMRRLSEGEEKVIQLSKRSDRLKNLLKAREHLTKETQATRRALESYKPWAKRKSWKALTPRQRENVADILSAKTTYYDMSPFSGYTKHDAAKHHSTALSRYRPPNFRAKKWAEQEAALRKKSPAYQDILRGKIRHFPDEVVSQFGGGENPFAKKDLWKKMSWAQRKEYIEHIKLNKKHIASDFGRDAGKLYMSEMMKALRKTL